MFLKKKYSLTNFAKSVFLVTMRYIIPYLSPNLLYLLADMIANLKKRSSENQINREELRILLGDKFSETELEKHSLKGISNHKKDLFEIWSFPRLNNKKIKKYAYLEGKENIDAALESGKGVVIGVSHFGSWKMIIAGLSYQDGYKVNQIGLDPRYFFDPDRPLYHNTIMDIEYRCDMSLPAKFIYIGKSIRPSFRALANNEIVINSFDGFIGSKKKEVPFLHGKNTLTLGPILLAVRTGAALLPIFAVRQEDNRHKIIIHENILSSKEKDEKIIVDKALEDYRKIFEEYVEKYPSHYCRTLYDRIHNPTSEN